MTKKSSTGALTQEQHASQDARYLEGHTYDYIIIGTGNSALTLAALLSHAGYKICMLEYHDKAGGYMQSFKSGEYTFCAQIHYVWGCGEGGKVYEFLKHIGLEKELTFNLYDPEGYDHVRLPDGKVVKIPYGFDQLAKNIDAAYPGQKEAVQKFCSVLTQIRKEMGQFPNRKISWYEYFLGLFKYRTLLKYRNRTLQDLFDECQLSKEAQAVLIGNAGDFMEPPENLSIFAYAGLFGGYNLGAYYPSRHFKFYTDRLTKFITDHPGCHIYYETPVNKINTSGKRVVSVETSGASSPLPGSAGLESKIPRSKKEFKAPNFICNMDPQSASKLMQSYEFTKTEKELLQYDYSPSGMVVYLGLKDIDLSQYGFGRHNLWHLGEWDMNASWKKQLSGDFSNPWFFISTPTLHSSAPGTTPPGGHILEIATLTDFESFINIQHENYRHYRTKKIALSNHLLDLVEQNYIPNLRKHIKSIVVSTPVTNEDFVVAKNGNSYGSRLVPQYMGMKRLKPKSSLENFYWCNASSGYAGFYGTVHTGMSLYMDLTGDRFYDESKSPTDNEVLEKLFRSQKQKV